MAKEQMEAVSWKDPSDDSSGAGTRGPADAQKLAKDLHTKKFPFYFLQLLIGILFNHASNGL